MTTDSIHHFLTSIYCIPYSLPWSLIDCTEPAEPTASRSFVRRASSCGCGAENEILSPIFGWRIWVGVWSTTTNCMRLIATHKKQCILLTLRYYLFKHSLPVCSPIPRNHCTVNETRKDDPFSRVQVSMEPTLHIMVCVVSTIHSLHLHRNICKALIP